MERILLSSRSTRAGSLTRRDPWSYETRNCCQILGAMKIRLRAPKRNAPRTVRRAADDLDHPLRSSQEVIGASRYAKATDSSIGRRTIRNPKMKSVMTTRARRTPGTHRIQAIGDVEVFSFPLLIGLPSAHQLLITCRWAAYILLIGCLLYLTYFAHLAVDVNNIVQS